MFSFEGTTPPQPVLDGVRRGTISAFCLFRHWNVESPAQLRTLSEMLLHAARAGEQLPPILGIDQEGGQLIAVTGGRNGIAGQHGAGRDALARSWPSKPGGCWGASYALWG